RRQRYRGAGSRSHGIRAHRLSLSEITHRSIEGSSVMAQLFGMARLGRDAELRYTQDGTAVASLALAFDYGKKGQDGKRPTQWVEASIWRQRAESLAPYLLKGTRLSVVVDDVHVETFQKSDGTQGVKLV